MQQEETELEKIMEHSYENPRPMEYEPVRSGNEIFYQETPNTYTIMTLKDPEPTNARMEKQEAIQLRQQHHRH